MRYFLNIFDLDGTLIDSHEAICMAINKTLAHFQLPERKFEELKKVIGIPLMKMLTTLGIPESQISIDVYREHYFQYLEEYQKIYPGVKDTLDVLKGTLSLAIVTNKGRNGTERSLKAVDIDPSFFDIILTEHELKKLKPDTEAFEKVLQYYRSQGKNLDKEDILMIGDSPVDMEFARNSGIDCAFVNWGFYETKDLSFEPTYEIGHPEELIDINGMNEVFYPEITPELDLHTYKPKDARNVVISYLLEASEKARKGDKTFLSVRIIHGKGRGVLKKMVRSVLEKTDFVASFYDAPGYNGGFGATIVEFHLFFDE